MPFRHRIRWNARAALAAAALACIVGPSVADARATVLPGNQRPRPDARIAEVAAKRPARLVDVIVQFNDGVSSNQGRAIVRALRGRHAEALPIVRGIGARMRAADALRLVKRHGVRAVTLDGPVHSQSVTVPTDATLSSAYDFTVGAFDMWPRATGKGVGVAVIDTGIDGALPDFRTSSTDPTSRVIASAVTTPGATTAADTYGHGTHVAGVIAGNGASR